MSCSGAVERGRSHSEGAHVRIDWSAGNHGEDVKEYWWYLDALPSHAWLRWRYHYPQATFPYQWLVEENARRSRDEPEAAGYRGFRRRPVLGGGGRVREGLTNRAARQDQGGEQGSDEAKLSVLPTLWFRNSWRFSRGEAPQLSIEGDGIVVDHPRLSGYRLDAAPTADGNRPQPLFCDNETNTARLFGSAPITAYPGRHQRPPHRGREHGEPRAARHPGVLVVRADGACPWHGGGAAAAASAGVGRRSAKSSGSVTPSTT